MSIVALEITPTRILLAAGRKAPRRPIEVSHAIEVPLEADCSDADISAKLKQAVLDNGLKNSDVLVVLSRSDSELREIELPPSPNDELPHMVMFKAKNDFASFNDRWLLDFVSLDEDETKPRRVLASAISPDVQQRIEQILEPTGLKLKQMVLRPFAIMDLLKGRTKAGSAQLVVSPGDSFTDIIVARGNQTLTTRSIRMAQTHNTDQQNRQLVSEVRRTIASSKRQLDGEKVQRLVLLDSEKSNRQLIGDLGQRLGLEIEVLDPFKQMHLIGQAKEQKPSPWKFAPLLGSMAHHGTDHAPGIDFLNPTRPVEKKSDRRKWWFYGALAGIAAAVMILFGWWTLSSQKTEIQELNQALVDQIKLNEGDATQPSVDTTLARVELLDGWQKANVQWLDELDQLSKRFLTADEAMVSKFDAAVKRNVPTVNVTGKIVSNEQDRKLFESLEGRPFVVTPTKADVIGDDDYPYAFGTRLTIERSGNDWLSAIDQHVREFRNQRKSQQPKSQQPSQGSVN